MSILGKRGRRRLAIGGLVVVVLSAGLVAAVPRLARLSVVQREIARRANAILAPSSASFAAVRFSWTGPTEIDRPILRDAGGVVVVEAPRATFTWTLADILLGRRRPAVLTLGPAALDLERDADGTVNLYETLRPVLSDHPEWPLTIDIRQGRLRFKDVRWDAPFVAERADVLLDLGQGWGPITWAIGLERAAPATGRLGIEGRFSRAEFDDQGRHDVRLDLGAQGWPLLGRGSVVGKISAERLAGRWRLDADLSFPGLAPGRPEVKPVLFKVALAGGDDAWTARGLEIVSPWWSLKGAGRLDRSPAGSKITADLVAVSADASRSPANARLTALVERRPGSWSVEFGLKGATREPGENLAVNGRADFDAAAARLRLADLSVRAPYVAIDGAGTIDNPRAPRIDLKGTIEPDWAALTRLLAVRIEPNARIAGGSRPWRLAGTLGGIGSSDPLAGVEAELGVHVDELDVFGLKLAATDVVARVAGGRVVIDPVQSRLNGGVLRLEPEIVPDDAGGWNLRLGSSSYLDKAAVNEEVSHRFLAYVAPVLEGATRVEGRVSLRVGEAVIPVGRWDKWATMTGELQFHDLEFLPGPLAADLFRVFRAESRPLLVLNDSLAVRVADGAVHQRGLKIPMGDLATVSLDGGVGFDRSLDLVAGLALEPRKGLPIPFGAKLSIPIKGTLDQPRIDATAMQDRLKSFGADLLENGAAIGLGGLGKLLEGLPERPFEGLFRARPPTEAARERRRLREERKADRLEKKAQRRQPPTPNEPAPPAAGGIPE